MSWKTGDRVLDLGCGPGRVTTKVLLPRLSADFSLLVGADLSADIVQYATKNYTHSKLRITQFDLAKDMETTHNCSHRVSARYSVSYVCTGFLITGITWQ